MRVQQVRGLVKQHIESFNYFLTKELQNILEANQEVRSEADPKFLLRYTKIEVGKPSVNEDMAERDVTPNECRLRDLTYSAPVYVDVKYTKGGGVQTAAHIQIGRIPIMLRSTKCVLAGMSEAQLERAKECVFDPGGYFIVKGVEKARASHGPCYAARPYSLLCSPHRCVSSRSSSPRTA